MGNCSSFYEDISTATIMLKNEMLNQNKLADNLTSEFTVKSDDNIMTITVEPILPESIIEIKEEAKLSEAIIEIKEEAKLSEAIIEIKESIMPEIIVEEYKVEEPIEDEFEMIN
jgi:hypothetical protein